MQLQPPPLPARKTQRSGATFWRAVFSAEEVPSAQDLRPRAQTHLPFGCSVVGVMWKPKAALNLQKKFTSLGTMIEPLNIIIFHVSDSPATRTLAIDLQQRGAIVPMHNGRKASPDRCVSEALVGTTEIARVGPNRWNDITAKDFQCSLSRAWNQICGMLD